MIINRNNYEELFLLYVDNELSASERMAVESFVSQNPDLKEELTRLKQSTLRPDNSISFNHKELLMSESGGNAVINNTNYEEFFLLYTDGELDSAGKKAVEEFASHHTYLHEELALLQRARLDPDDTILFEHKEILYKKEEDRKVFWLPRLRIAAAILILLAGYLVFRNSVTYTGKPVVSGVEPRTATANKPVAPVAGNEIKKEQPAVTQTIPDPLYNTDRKKETIVQQEKKAKPAKLPVRPNREKTRNDKDVFTANLPAKKEFRKPDNDQPPAIVKNEPAIDTDIKSSLLKSPGNMPVVKENEPVADIAAGRPEPNPFVNHAVVNEPEADAENNVNISAFPSKKNKMRGFFRKVSRVFEKTTNVDDDRNKRDVLIGNFQIALK
jgi:hypothetical protein